MQAPVRPYSDDGTRCSAAFRENLRHACIDASEPFSELIHDAIQLGMNVLSGVWPSPTASDERRVIEGPDGRTCWPAIVGVRRMSERGCGGRGYRRGLRRCRE